VASLPGRQQRPGSHDHAPIRDRATVATFSVQGDVLALLQDIDDALNALRDDRDEAIQAARMLGCTWPEIGTALGVSAQAAQQMSRRARRDPARRIGLGVTVGGSV
jgi:DNA-directed RNA polymerase specialized sigma24 family protein